MLVRNCARLPTIVVIFDESSPLRKGPKKPQMRTVVDDCAQIAESGLKPPIESPHLDFPEFCKNPNFTRNSLRVSCFLRDLECTKSIQKYEQIIRNRFVSENKIRCLGAHGAAANSDSQALKAQFSIAARGASFQEGL